MALQYDAPIASSDITDALAANVSLTDSTRDVISQLLALTSSDTVSVATVDADGNVTAPADNSAAAVISTIDGNVGDNVTVDLSSDAVANAKALVFASDANLTVNTTAFSVDQVLVTGNGNDNINVGTGNNTIVSGNGNDTIVAADGSNHITLSTGNNSVNVGDGNNTIVAGTGNDTITAGSAGYDVVSFAGTGVSAAANGDSVVVSHDSGASSVLTGVNFITLDNNASIAIADNDDQASTLRLYQALLGRDADQGGAQSWVAGVDSGAAVTDVAQAFLSSAEYTNNSNTDFVNSLYENLLDHAADADGQQYWVSLLSSGVSRTDLVNAFSGSEEASALSDSAYINALYETALGRGADADGQDYWLSVLDSGVSKSVVAASILASTEAGNNDNASFVESLYQSALGRTADADGKANWVAALESGVSQAEVAVAIVGSAEAVAHNEHVVTLQHGLA